jgi:thiamine-phosphate pyrophosphorylase
VAIDYSLYLVADAGFASGRDLVTVIERAVRGGVTVVQIRGKGLPYDDFVGLGRRASAALRKLRVPLIINDRADVALACGAAGVHLGQDDMPLRLARKVLAENMVIGVSASTREESLEAQKRGADYIGLGPIFPTASKETSLPPVGPEGIRNVKARVRIPVVAIGGITTRNARAVLEAGADGIAVISAILGPTDTEGAARQLKNIFRRWTSMEGHHA